MKETEITPIRELTTIKRTRSPKTVKELFDGYKLNVETGKVVGFGGKLNIRPDYQREFIYKKPEQRDVIATVINDGLLSDMVWVDKKDGTFECLDGQQRTLSICQFLDDKLEIKFRGKIHVFSSLPKDIQDRINNYELQIWEIQGTESEIQHVFKMLNKNNNPLTQQEIRNALYTGSWLTSAKAYFSRKANNIQVDEHIDVVGCADADWKHLTGGDAERQGILEIALAWITGSSISAKPAMDENICRYMAQHRNDADASELINYFKKVCEWVKEVTGDNRNYKDEVMLGTEWGLLYKKYHGTFKIDNQLIAEKMRALRLDIEVNGNSKKFYPYIISGDPQVLCYREFDNKMRKMRFNEQNEVCAICKKKVKFKDTEAHHIISWAEGGKTVYENCMVLCKDCHTKAHANANIG